jgi:hypothetical protein
VKIIKVQKSALSDCNLLWQLREYKKLFANDKNLALLRFTKFYFNLIALIAIVEMASQRPQIVIDKMLFVLRNLV